VGLRIFHLMQTPITQPQAGPAHQVQVARSQAALAPRPIRSFQVRLANHNQVVARKGSLAQSVSPPPTTSTTK